MWTDGLSWWCLNVGLGLAAVGVAERTLPGRPAVERLLAGVAGYVLAACGAMLLLGVAQQLSRGPAVAGALLLALVTAPMWLRRLRRPMPAPSGHTSPSIALTRWAFAAASGFWLLRLTLEPRVVTMDDAAYHATKVGRWLASGTLEDGDLGIHSSYPAHAELLSAFHALPFGHDAWVGAAAVAFAAVQSLAVLALARREDAQIGWPAYAVAASGLSSPVILRAGASFSAVDIAVSAFLLASLAFLRTARHDTPAARGAFGWCFATAGFAVGVKPAAAPVALGVFAVLAWVAPRHFPEPGQRLRVGMGCALALLPLGFWYWRNWLRTGNPLHPVPLPGLPGVEGFGAGSIANYLSAFPDAAHAFEAARVLLDWPYAFAAASAAGLLWTAFAVLRRRAQEDRVLLLLGLLALAVHPFAPFSSGNPTTLEAGVFHPTAARYQIFGFLVGGILLAARLAEARAKSLGPFVGVGLLAGSLVLVPNDLRWLALAALVMTAPTLALAWWQRLIAGTPMALPAAATILVLLAATVAGTPAKTRQADRHASVDRPERRIGFSGWMTQQVEALPAGSRVASVGLGRARYPLLGRRFQHELVDWQTRPSIDDVLDSGAGWLFVGDRGKPSDDLGERLEATGRAVREAERASDGRGLRVTLFRLR